MIEVRNLTKKYGDHVAVDNLSFTVEKGQIYGFLGPNGAGKSTTMNIITGYLATGEGDVFIDGHNILEEPEEAKACIGYLPEIPPLYPDMTVREYLEFAAELKRIPKAERRGAVEEAEQTLMIEDVSDRLIKNLSKGYKQRVGFAQAILGMPEILILDEPTVGLDPKQIIEIRDLIKRLGENHTIILSSHILSEVSEICDHVMIISGGRLIASDTPDNLMKMMKPEKALKLTIKIDRSTANEVLSGLKDLEEYTLTGAEEEGAVKVSVKYSVEMDLRETVSAAFAARGGMILSMNEEKASLEDVFLELTEADVTTDDPETEDVEATTDEMTEPETEEDETSEADAEETAGEERGDSHDSDL